MVTKDESEGMERSKGFRAGKSISELGRRTTLSRARLLDHESAGAFLIDGVGLVFFNLHPDTLLHPGKADLSGEKTAGSDRRADRKLGGLLGFGIVFVSREVSDWLSSEVLDLVVQDPGFGPTKELDGVVGPVFLAAMKGHSGLQWVLMEHVFPVAGGIDPAIDEEVGQFFGAESVCAKGVADVLEDEAIFVALGRGALVGSPSIRSVSVFGSAGHELGETLGGGLELGVDAERFEIVGLAKLIGLFHGKASRFAEVGGMDAVKAGLVSTDDDRIPTALGLRNGSGAENQREEGEKEGRGGTFHKALLIRRHQAAVVTPFFESAEKESEEGVDRLPVIRDQVRPSAGFVEAMPRANADGGEDGCVEVLDGAGIFGNGVAILIGDAVNGPALDAAAS